MYKLFKRSHIPGLFEVMSGRKVVDDLPFDLGVEAPVEVFESPLLAEAGRFDPPGDFTILADQFFVLEQQLKELQVAEPVTGCFLQTNLQAVG